MKSLRSKILAVVVALALATSVLPAAYGWSNGGSNRTAEQAESAADKADTSTPEAFSLNIKPVVTGSGAGISTHDLILEQAIAQAIYAGADVSWIDFSVAQLATDDPDNVASVRKTYPLGEDYRGYRLGGTGPRAVGNLYKRIASELAMDQKAAAKEGNESEESSEEGEKGEEGSEPKSKPNKLASKYLGWAAHMIGDMSQPFHIVPWNQTRVIKTSRWHALHVSFETDLGYLMKYSVGKRPSRWQDFVVAGTQYLPALAASTNKTTAQERRLQWFGGSYKKPPLLKTSARVAVINMTKRVRTTYGQAALKAWNKTWKKGYQETTPQLRGSGSKWLVTNAPGMLSEASNTLGSLIVALSSSDPEKTAVGLDKIKKPTLKVKVNKLSKKMAKKYTSYTATATIKSATGKAMKEVPVDIVFKRNGKTIKKNTVWTNSKGQAAYSYVPARKTKAAKITAEVKVATADYDKVVKVSKTLKKLAKAKKKK